ncbi:hypothetical protein ACFE04_024559 [Oxalis oulophora]
MSRNCSQCGSNGHNSRTCGTEVPGGGNGIMLFGVRVNTAPPPAQDQLINNSFRKSLSMNNLSQYDQQPPQDSNADAGYASDDVVHASGKSRERKRGVPWTEEEHKLFLEGLKNVGKGDWRGISRNFVKTRTPTQVASHAQKYFLRRNNQNRRRRRSSLFDMTHETIEEDNDQAHNEIVTKQQPQGFSLSTFNAVTVHPINIPIPPTTGDNSMDQSLTLGIPSTSNGKFKIKSSSTTKPTRPLPILPIPPSSKMANLNLNHKSRSTKKPNLPLTLKLSTPSSDDQPSPSSSSSTHSSSAFQAMSSGDSIISVA